jgi:hypothetical protein
VSKPLVLIGIVGMALACRVARAGLIVPDKLLCPGILIRAGVHSIEPPPKGAGVHMQVLEVYAGALNLMGRTFLLKFNSQGQSSQGSPALSATPKIGDQGVFIMQIEKDKLVVDQVHGSLGMIQLPVMSTDPGGTYDSAIAWAESIGKWYAASPPLRNDLLQKAVFDSRPPVSAWAMEVLGEASAKDSPGTLDLLVAESQLPLAAQLVLDKYLCSVRATIWLDSPVRLRMIDGWVKTTAIPDEQLMRFVAVRLCQAVGTKQLTGRGLLRVVQLAANNPTMPEQIKQSYMHLLTAARGELGASNEAFEFLSKQITSAGTEGLALAAATALRDTCQLDGARRTVLESSLRQIKSPKVAEIVKQAINAKGR